MAAQAGQSPIRVFTLTVTLPGLPERWRLAYVGCLELAYNGAYLGGHPGRSEAYMRIHPNGYPSGSPLKDQTLPTLTVGVSLQWDRSR